MMRSRSGITIVELLIAAAIVGVLLLITAQLYGGTVRAYRVNEEVSETRQGIQAAISLLQYEIGLAGYRCTDGSALTRTFASDPLIAVDGTAGAPDRITVRYYEDRYASGSCEFTSVDYFVEGGALYRQVDGQAAVEAVQGVQDMQVVAWLNRANSEFAVPTSSANLNRPPDRDLRGVSLRLDFLDDAGRENPIIVTVGLKNPQCRTLGDCS